MKKHLLKIDGSITYRSIAQRKTALKCRNDNITAMIAIIRGENKLNSAKSKPKKKIIGKTMCQYCRAELDYIISIDGTVSFRCSTKGCMSVNI